MTREEAIRIAQGLITDFKCESEMMVEFCNMAIKALKQELVLDKIRAEIEQNARPNRYGKSVRYGLCKALEIIDKYRKVN